MGRKLDSVLDLIHDIENNFPLEKLVYMNVNWWPVFRSEIGVLARNERELVALNFSRKSKLYSIFILLIKIPILFKKYLFQKYSWKNKIKALDSKPISIVEPDFITLSSFKHRTDLFENYDYNRYTDPIHFYLKPLKGFNIEIINEALKVQKYPYLTYFFHTSLAKHKLKFSCFELRKLLSLRKSFTIGDSFIDLCVFVNDKLDSKLIDFVSVQSKIWTIVNYYFFFSDLFSKCKPKIVFLSSYYSEYFFGAIWAAKEFGIEIYDYQHGIQGDYHFAYSKWLNMPVNGYTFLPNFLVYSSLDKISLDASFTNEKHPKSFIVGNLWNKFWLENCTKDSNLEKTKNYTKYILYTLSPIKPYFPKFLLEFMQKSNNTFWWIRVHPRYKFQQNEVELVLKMFSIKNYEIELSTNLPIQEVLINSDIHITQYSSTSLDALDFGIKTILVDKQGKLLYKNLIDSGDLFFCDNENDLASLVEADIFTSEIKSNDFVGLKSLFCLTA